MTPDPRHGVRGFSVRVVRGGRPPSGLVVAGWVEGEVADQFAGGGVDDADVDVLGTG